MTPRRFLYIVFNQVGVGTYQRAYQFSRELVARGHQVSLVATAPRERLRIRERNSHGIRIVEAPDLLAGPLRSGWDPYDVICRWDWVRRGRFDIVHAIESRPVVLYPALAAQAHGAALVMDWCDWLGRGGSVEERPNALVRTLLRPVESFFEERFRGRGRGTVTISSFLRDRAISLGVAPATITVVRNGCDASLPLLDKKLARASLGIPQDARVLAYAGTAYSRDAVFLCRAFNEVHRALRDSRLYLIGYFNRQVEPFIDDPGAVHRTGRISDQEVHEFLSAADLCWLPLCDTGTNRARWPGKLNHYLSAGRPTLATQVGDAASVVTDWGVGLTTPDDPHMFSDATLRLLTEADMCVSMGKRAREIAQGPLSWARMTDRLEEVYSQL